MSLHLHSFDKGLLKQRLFLVAGSIIAITAVVYGIVALLGNTSGAASSYWQFNQLANSTSREWTTLDTSADGVKIVAAVASGNIYTSADSGVTWIARTAAGSRAWKSVASSYDGTRLVAATVSGNIYTSADSGVTWSTRTAAGSRNWADVDISGDGMKLIAAVTGTSGSRSVYTSVDAGATWASVTNLSSAINWTAVAISGDGNSIAAANSSGSFSGVVVVSHDAGANWESGAGYRNWSSIAFSNDGDEFVAVSSSDEQMFVYRKDDDDPWDITNLTGATNAVALSGDGTTIAVSRPNGEIALSADYGITWSDQSAAGVKEWADVALTTDGKKLTAVATNEYAYSGSVVLSANAPTNLVGVAGNEQVALTWTAPTNNGGTAITDYKIEYSSNGGNQWNEFSHSASTATAQTVTGLVNGYEYIFRVSAVNVAGQGEFANMISARPSDGTITIGPAQTIAVTTFSDEDSAGSVGAGCSLREAIIASNTTQPYGGCPAGGGANDVIYLPNGTYAFGNQGQYDLYVYGASIVGEDINDTIIRNLSFTFAGTTETGINNLTLSSNGPPTDIRFIGSNKNITDVVSKGSITASVLIGNEAFDVTGTLLSNYTIEAELPNAAIQCLETCRQTTIEDSSFSAQSSVSVNVGSEVTLRNVFMTAQQNMDLQLGQNSDVSGLTMIGDDNAGTNVYFALGAGSVIDDITQTGGANVGINGSLNSVTNVAQTGNSISNYYTAEQVDGMTMDAIGSLNFTNNFVGASIKNITIDSAAYYTSINLEPALLENFSLSGDNQTSVYLDIAGTEEALIKNVSITGINDFSGTLEGNEIVVENFEADSVDFETLTVTGVNPKLSDITLTNISLSLQNTGSPTLERITTNGSAAYSGAISINGNNDDVIIRDSFINSPLDSGIEVSTNVSSGSSLLVENTQIQNLSNTSSANGALNVAGIDEVTLNRVTVNNAKQQYYAAVIIDGGINHSIVNTTVSDSNGGIALQGSWSTITPAEVTINNSTIVNNTATDLSAWISGGVSMTSNSGQPYDVSITNSIIAGNEGTQCAVDSGSGDVTLTATNNVSSDTSCGTGVTGVDVDDVIVATIADNSSEAPSIGSGRLSGKVQTFALKPESAALLAGGTLSCAPYDARGLQRDVAAGCDVGAYQTNIFVTPPVAPGSGNNGGSGNTQPPTQTTQKPETSTKPQPSNGIAVVPNVETETPDTTPSPSTEQTPSSANEDNENSATTDTKTTDETSFIPWIIGGLVAIVAVVIATLIIRRSARN